MLISLSTGSLFTLPLKKVCELSAAAGFDGVELIINQDFQRINPAKLVAALQEITTIHSIHAPFMPLDGWGGTDGIVAHLHRAGRGAGYPAGQFSSPFLDGLRGRFLALALQYP